jgi:osmotically-inducible protein OsmY
VPDDVIVRTTLRELDRDPATARERIGVDSEAGVLTLRGSLASRLPKERAVDVAHVVRGVRAIIDRTEVLPEPRPDYELDFAAAGALAHDPVTSGQRIAARTHQAVVLLSGSVDSNAARRIAEADVLTLPGVRDVVSHLATLPPGAARPTSEPRSDDRIAAEVDRLIRNDPWLDDSHVRVSARAGLVRLEGWVGSAAERARAENDAWAASPTGVDAMGLRLDRFIDDGTLRSAPTTQRSDGELTQALLDAFVRDPRVHPFAPTVEVRGGMVVLTGVAPNQHVARAVDDDARALPGIAGVRDDVKTLPAVYSQTDAEVRDEVARAILRDPALGPSGVEVDVLRGRVFLRGTVASNRDRLRAISIATSAPGARDVHDGLVVAPPETGVTNRQPR